MALTRILFVEDDKLQAKLTKDYLEKNGYEIIHVENGASAIKVAKTQPVDLIILDLVLPDMDGNEVSRWLKIDEDTKAIPIIMLTAKGTTMDKVTGLKAGADDYLAKPYNEIELNARIYASLRTKALQDELKKKNRELEEVLTQLKTLSITDPLTEIFNRRHFWSVLENEFARSVRFKTPIACLMIDADHFKNINDEYGHHAGDIVLKEIAKIIKNCLREVDTAARWGGEEFIVLLHGTDKEHALTAASRILSEISVHTFTGIQRKITVSIGIASVPGPAIDTPEKLIEVSDSALYAAKANGRNRVEIAE
ncbi:MAG: diguanylate cyclase [Nitrospira sp.]|nr:diguanylate cyclase [Nitrospira sp.]